MISEKAKLHHILKYKNPIEIETIKI